MAYYSALCEDKQSQLYSALQQQVSKEAQSMYETALSRAKTKRQKQACAGQYIGAWYRLLDGWMKDNITNLHVRDCLSYGHVIGGQYEPK